MTRSRVLGAAVYGALVFTAVHLALASRRRDIPVGAGEAAWWLDSGEGILWTEAVLFMAAVLATLPRSGAPWGTGLAMMGGVMASATVILFSIGPGTIFPVVLAGCLVLSSVPVFAGVGMVEAVRALIRGGPKSDDLARWGLAAALVLPAWGCASNHGPPSAATSEDADRPAASTRADAPSDPVLTARERAENEAAYRENIVGRRQFLLQRDLGRWVAIAGGRAFPVNEYGTAVRPAATMEEADAAARAAVPGARHRFVFRIGEEGDLRQDLGGAELPHVLGVWFLAELERPDVEMRGLGPRQPIWFVKDGVRTEITAKGPDDRMFLRPEVGPPGAVGRADALYCLSTGFSGFAVLPAESAASALLHLWEVPGKITMDGDRQKGECRRARARFRFPGTDLDLVIPVAVWGE